LKLDQALVRSRNSLLQKLKKLHQDFHQERGHKDHLRQVDYHY